MNTRGSRLGLAWLQPLQAATKPTVRHKPLCVQVPIPDILPQEVPGIGGLLSMVAGDFVEVYGRPGYSSKFDAVATCFFLDTAHNIFEYIDVIWNTLKVRGL